MFFPLKDENPTEGRQVLPILLIVVNAAIFVYSFVSGDLSQIAKNWGMVPEEISSGRELYTIFTSMFIHGGILHAVGNLWFLFVFGDNIEDLFGKPKFLVIYFISGIVASLAHVALHPSSEIVTIGASGAISGILGAYLVKYPRVKVLTLVYWIVIRVPSFLFLGFWILMKIFYASYTTIVGVDISVAYWAHVGGFATGAALALSFPERDVPLRQKRLMRP